MNNIELEKRIAKIELRNKKVTADKAWELSKTRKSIIFVITYLFAGLFLAWLNASKPWFSALILPSTLLLSTLAIQKIKII
ncbi:MAG: hypothetical protein WCP03_00170 [Candidatus Saccharibacteria bacterium]